MWKASLVHKITLVYVCVRTIRHWDGKINCRHYVMTFRNRLFTDSPHPPDGNFSSLKGLTQLSFYFPSLLGCWESYNSSHYIYVIQFSRYRWYSDLNHSKDCCNLLYGFQTYYTILPRDDRDGKVPWKRNIVFFGAAT